VIDDALMVAGDVALPNDAVSAVEMLDEPGLAADGGGGGSIALTGANDVLLSRTITVPADGHVIAIASLEISAGHTQGTPSSARFGVSDNSSTFLTNQDMLMQLWLTLPSGTYVQPLALQGVFNVEEGSNTFYVLGDELTGNFSVFDRQLSLIYLPTAYGTVVANSPSQESSADPQEREPLTRGEIDSERESASRQREERLERELETIRTELEQIKDTMRSDRD
jgi:hypothetical protein